MQGYWEDINHNLHKISDMSKDYKTNCVKHLEKRLYSVEKELEEGGEDAFICYLLAEGLKRKIAEFKKED